MGWICLHDADTCGSYAELRSRHPLIMSTTAPFRLWVSGGSRKQVEEISCATEVCRIGKDDSNLIMLQGWTVAAHHAQIMRRPEGLYVEDTGSRAGTAVNGVRIQAPYGPLQPADEIQIGAYRITVRDDTPAVLPQAVQAPPIAQDYFPVEADRALVPAMPPIDFAMLRNLHERLISRMDLRRIDTTRMADTELRSQTRTLLDQLVREDVALRERGMIANDSLTRHSTKWWAWGRWNHC